MAVIRALTHTRMSLQRGSRISRSPSELARPRLAVLDWHREHGGVVRLGARQFGLSPDTVSRWSRAFAAHGVDTLEDRGRRPDQVRRPSTPSPVVIRIWAIREAYPRWGREKIRTLLLREGIRVSGKTIDCTIARLRTRGELREPLSDRRARHRPRAARAPAPA